MRDEIPEDKLPLHDSPTLLELNDDDILAEARSSHILSSDEVVFIEKVPQDVALKKATKRNRTNTISVHQ